MGRDSARECMRMCNATLILRAAVPPHTRVQYAQRYHAALKNSCVGGGRGECEGGSACWQRLKPYEIQFLSVVFTCIKEKQAEHNAASHPSPMPHIPRPCLPSQCTCCVHVHAGAGPMLNVCPIKASPPNRITGGHPKKNGSQNAALNWDDSTFIFFPPP